MSGLSLPKRKSAPSADCHTGPTPAAAPVAGGVQGPPPLPASGSSMPVADAGQAWTLPPPPPPEAGQFSPTPTPTSLHGGSTTRVHDGLGIAGGILLKLVMLVVANGIGFGVWWYTQGPGGDRAESPAAAGALQADGETSEPGGLPAAEPGPDRIEAMYLAADTVDWPMVMLSGMVAGASAGRTSAILNGVLVTQRQTIEGIELIEVRRDGVVLQFENTRKYIRVGEST